MRFRLVALLLLTFAGAASMLCLRAEGDAKADSSAYRMTVAHRVLDVGPEDARRGEFSVRLESLLERALAKVGSKPPTGEDEAAVARKFFRAVDDTLNEFGAVFPPDGRVELLASALAPRNPGSVEFERLTRSFANSRRQEGMLALHKAGEPLYYFDCDVASLIYVAAAQRLGYPVYLVEVPGHNFVRWSSPGLYLNWDPNDGGVAPDDYYRRRLPADAAESRLLGYLENRTEARVMCYWLVRAAHALARAGDHASALEKLRTAVSTAPEDLVAQGELAWALATVQDPKLRNAEEARSIAERLVGLMPRRAWLETLAAACAETGDFELAVEFQSRAEMAVRGAGVAAPKELAAYHESLIKAYRDRKTYADAFKAGLLKPVN